MDIRHQCQRTLANNFHLPSDRHPRHRSCTNERTPPQAHPYTAKVKQSLHRARGEGLSTATTGVPTSFTIELIGDHGHDNWSTGDERFIYVWIANEYQVSEEIHAQRPKTLEVVCDTRVSE